MKRFSMDMSAQRYPSCGYCARSMAEGPAVAGPQAALHGDDGSARANTCRQGAIALFSSARSPGKWGPDNAAAEILVQADRHRRIGQLAQVTHPQKDTGAKRAQAESP
jgi:hypothetical protein